MRRTGGFPAQQILNDNANERVGNKPVGSLRTADL